MDNNDISSILSGVMSNPEIMSKLSGVLNDPEAMKSISNAVSGIMPQNRQDEHRDNNGREDRREEQQEHHHGNDEAKNRARLIAALKPYLNPERREKAEKLMGFLTLLELSGSSGLFNIGKGGK